MCGGVGPSGLPMDRSMMSSPARLAACLRSPTTLKTYGGSRLMRGNSMRRPRMRGHRGSCAAVQRGVVRAARTARPPRWSDPALVVLGVRVLHVARRRPRHVLAVVASDHAKRQIDAGGDAGRREEV